MCSIGKMPRGKQLRGMRRTAFGHRYGVRVRQVNQWANLGVIECFEDGSVHVPPSDASLAVYVAPWGKRSWKPVPEVVEKQYQQGFPAPGQQPAAPAPAAPAAVAPAPPAELPDHQSQIIPTDFSVTATSRAEAAQNKDQADALLKMLRYRKEAGELVERHAAEAIMFAFFRQERDAWLSWPDRVGPELAAMLEVDPRITVIALKELVGQHLDELSTSEPPTLEQDL